MYVYIFLLGCLGDPVARVIDRTPSWLSAGGCDSGALGDAAGAVGLLRYSAMEALGGGGVVT